MLSINFYNKNLKNSTKYSGFYNKEMNLNEFDDNSSEEFYDSPEYTI